MDMDIDITPRVDALEALGVSQIDFDAALEAALDNLAFKSPKDLPAPDAIPIQLLGEEHPLGEVARIDVIMR